MKKTILLALLVLAVAAVPAMASVQNVKISGDVDSTYFIRNNFDLGAGASGSSSGDGDNKNDVFITQTRLRVDADLTDQVSATIALINERAWGDSTTDTAGTDIDLNLAFVTLREMLYSPMTVVIGRQEFHYGNSLVMDTAGTNNGAPGDSGLLGVANDLTKQTAQDAIRVIFDYNPLTFEVFFSQIDQKTVTAAGEDDDDINLWGFNSTYDLGDDMDTQVEAYFFAKVDKFKGEVGSGAVAVDNTDTIYLPGVRVSTNPLEGLNLQLEYAHQSGTKTDPGSTASAIPDNQQRNANAAQVIANYQVPVMEDYKPVLQGVFTYVSGDNDATGSVISSDSDSTRSEYNAWDPFFENQGGGTIYSAILDLTNLFVYNVSLQANPMEDVTAKVSWTGLYLAQDNVGTSFTLKQPGGGTGSSPGTSTSVAAKDGKDEVGHEVDVELVYDYTEDVQIGAKAGWFFAGDLFGEANEKTATQALANVNVNF